MKAPAKPFQFLLSVGIGWAGLRLAMIGWTPSAAPVRDTPLLPDQERSRHLVAESRLPFPFTVKPAADTPVKARRSSLVAMPQKSPPLASLHPLAAEAPRALLMPLPAHETPPSQPPFFLARNVDRTSTTSRWAGDAWAFVRNGESDGLYPNAVLGGSQIGGRLRYRFGSTQSRLQASLRFYAPMRNMTAGDVALGVDWRPLPAVAVHVLAERREAVGVGGRSAFSLIAYGGLSRKAGGGTFDLYGQAGIVGARSRDAFAEGIATLRWDLDDHKRVKAGVGIWGAAQPGAERLDVGPTLAVRPARDSPATIALEWRQRIAGTAAPASGPALTLSVGF